jgi:RES domain-containing protein
MERPGNFGLPPLHWSGQVLAHPYSPQSYEPALNVLMEAILKGINYGYADEASSGAPASSEYQVQYLTPSEVVDDVASSQGLDWPEALMNDVAGSLTEETWVEAPRGIWMSSHDHELLRYSWEQFAAEVKYKSRFHFNRPSSRESGDTLSVREMLPYLGQLMKRHRMVQVLSSGTDVYRVRDGAHPHDASQLGPPPGRLVPAGRMNPVGIPYFYLSFDEDAALAEARPAAGGVATVSRWRIARDLHVLDLTKSVKGASIFSGRWGEHDLAVFMYDFVDEVSQPIERGGAEHIEYLPTQVVSEFFAQSFTFGKEQALDGIIFPSSIVHGRRNLVLFPHWDYDREPDWSYVVLEQSKQVAVPAPGGRAQRA